MKLYKYFPMERVDFVHHRLVRLTPPTELNDPFDMLPIGKVTFRKKQVTKATKPPPGTPGSIFPDLRRPLGDAMGQMLNRGHLLQRFASLDYGVLCLSERYDSLLMWAHYASDHRGFVVEFDASHQWLNQGKANPNALDIRGLHKITYSDERPTAPLSLEPDLSVSSLSKLIDSYFTKGSDWSYEVEWRLVMQLNQATKTVSLSPDNIQSPSNNMLEDWLMSPKDIKLFEVPHTAISSIILGWRISEADRKTLMQCREIPNFDHVRLLQAKLSPRRFGLEFKPLPEKQSRTRGARAHKSRKPRSR